MKLSSEIVLRVIRYRCWTFTPSVSLGWVPFLFNMSPYFRYCGLHLCFWRDLWKYITVCFRKFNVREMHFDQTSKYPVWRYCCQREESLSTTFIFSLKAATFNGLLPSWKSQSCEDWCSSLKRWLLRWGYSVFLISISSSFK